MLLNQLQVSQEETSRSLQSATCFWWIYLVSSDGILAVCVVEADYDAGNLRKPQRNLLRMTYFGTSHYKLLFSPSHWTYYHSSPHDCAIVSVLWIRWYDISDYGGLVPVGFFRRQGLVFYIVYPRCHTWYWYAPGTRRYTGLFFASQADHPLSSDYE